MEFKQNKIIRNTNFGGNLWPLPFPKILDKKASQWQRLLYGLNCFRILFRNLPKVIELILFEYR
jgi:hypothetical protein